jgi:hypothetical protein
MVKYIFWQIFEKEYPGEYFVSFTVNLVNNQYNNYVFVFK